MQLMAIAAIVACLITSCKASNHVAVEDEGNAQNVAMQFAKALKGGDFNTAKYLLLEDKENIDVLEKIQQGYNTQGGKIKEGLKASSLQNWKSNAIVLDSIYEFEFINSYTQKNNHLKLVNQKGKYRVDLKYTTNGN
jgi:hypothetical protein